MTPIRSPSGSWIGCAGACPLVRIDAVVLRREDLHGPVHLENRAAAVCPRFFFTPAGPLDEVAHFDPFHHVVIAEDLEHIPLVVKEGHDESGPPYEAVKVVHERAADLDESFVALQQILQFVLLQYFVYPGCVRVDVVLPAAPPRFDDDIGDDQRVVERLIIDELFPLRQDLAEPFLVRFLHCSTSLLKCPIVSHEWVKMGHVSHDGTR